MNSRARPSLLFTALALLAISAGCKQTNFASVDNDPKQTKLSQTLSCSDEKQKSVSLKSLKTNEINFSKSCTSEASSTRTPADIVFVIDITGSMEDSLNAVKNGVEKFALGLRQDKGWDARFAAVGYRDNIAAQVGFTDEKNLAAQIASWKAIGGNDAQEAGQLGLATAVEILTRDLAANPSRSAASKNILFIGDAISYALNNDHFDFSTTQLERVFAGLPAELRSKMKFYHSAAKEIEQCLRPALFGCAETGRSSKFAAYEQITALAKKLELPGKGFDFPFTESILLKEFMDEFTPGQACTFKSATIRDSTGKEIALVNESGTYELPRNLQMNSLNIEVERCCGSGQAAVTPPVPTASPKDVKIMPVASTTSGCKVSKNTFSLKVK
ncbi:MAG: von Willebrand factor type domain [Pseudomonadota bacterium]|jgi:hypothetical protein